MSCYYKKIFIDDLEIIQSKVLQFIKNRPAIYYRRSATSYNWLDVPDLLTHCPELVTSFAKFDLTITFAASHCMWFNNQSIVHIDRVPWECRINVPILNTKGSSTVFYTNVQYKDDVHIMADGRKYDVYTTTNTDFVEVDRVEIDQPTVLRVRAAHRVIMNQLTAPRINLTLGFNRDPVYMLEGEDQ
jgi:hypothetical protein